MFNDKELETIDKLLNTAARNALGLILSFSTKATHRPTTDMGLGYVPMKDRVTEMGIEYIT